MSLEERIPEAEVAEQAAPPPLWRNRDFMLLWSGQAVSTAGTQVARLAFPLLILALTGSPAQAGLAGAVALLPYLVFSLPAGALVDRWNRKRVMILCDSGRLVAAGSVPLTIAFGHLSLVQLYAVVLIEGVLYVFFDLAETAALPRIVGREQLPIAMSQNSATFSAASLVGQPLGGLLFQLGHGVPFLADAVSYGASVFSLLFVRGELQGDRTVENRNLRAEIWEGLTWLWSQPLIRFMAFLAAGAWLGLSGTSLLVIVIARHLHAAPATIGLIFAINGVGGIVGAVSSGFLQRRLGFAPVVIGTMWIWAALFPLYAVAPSPLVLGVITGGIFLVFPIYNVVQMSYRLALIPDELQGRVNSAFRLIAFAPQPVAVALTGALLQTVGIRGTVLITFAWLLILAIATSLSKPIRTAAPIRNAR
jgi:MFS family permease